MTMNTINYGTIRMADRDEIVRPFDTLIDLLDFDNVEIWRLATGEVVGVDLFEDEDDDFEEDWDDLECGFDPYEGCYSFDC